jgi:type IV fimbrial biogenesis protein FimT
MRTPQHKGYARRRLVELSLYSRTRSRAVSLIELMIVVAISALIVSLAAPSLSDYVVTQRLRSVHAQMMTDLQFARSEAVSRGSFVSVRFQFTTGPTGASCYIIYTRPVPTSTSTVTCDCLQPEGSRCAASPTTTTEIRTVTVPNTLQVNLRVASGQPDHFTYDPRVGSLRVTLFDESVLTSTGYVVTTSAGSARALRAVVLGSGRAMLCTPAGSNLGGPACT